MQKHEREALIIVKDSLRNLPVDVRMVRIGSAHGSINITGFERVWKKTISSSPRTVIDGKVRSWARSVRKEVEKIA